MRAGWFGMVVQTHVFGSQCKEMSLAFWMLKGIDRELLGYVSRGKTARKKTDSEREGKKEFGALMIIIYIPQEKKWK